MKWSVMTPEAQTAYILGNPGMPYSLIADALQTTKAAVSMRAHKSGIKRQVVAAKKSTAPKVERRGPVLPASPAVVAAPRPALPPLQCEPVTLLDLQPHHCRWPTWGGRTQMWKDPKAKADVALFCGAQKAADGSYCQAHAEVTRDTYQPSRARVAPPADFRARKAAPEPVETDAFDIMNDNPEMELLHV